VRRVILKKLSSKERKIWEREKGEEWKKNAAFWIKIIRENLDPFRLKITNKAILEPLKSKKNLKIFDVGCGEGYLCRTLAKKGHRVFGIDSCPKLIKAAQDLEKKSPLGVKYFVGDFRKTSFPPSYFDVILSHQTINEIPNPGKAFWEFFRILKKNGKLILLFLHPCFEINPQKYFQKVKIKKRYYLVSGIKSSSPYFYLHLPLSEWIRLLEKSRFLIKRIEEPHPSLKLLKKDKWWRKTFKKPLFILIEAIKA
jgi:ubiquinone/menaquinone biosynthesis C-methylase UbiE